MNNVQIDVTNDLIFTTVGKYRLFLAYEEAGRNGMDAYLLYSHLMYVGRWQSTNQVWANNSYIRNGLNWGETRLKKAKDLLKELGLMEVIKSKPDKKNKGKFSKTYIKIITHSPLSEKDTTALLENRVRLQPLPDDKKQVLKGESKVLKGENKISKDNKQSLLDSKIYNFTRKKKQPNKKTNTHSNKNKCKIGEPKKLYPKEYIELIELWNNITGECYKELKDKSTRLIKPKQYDLSNNTKDLEVGYQHFKKFQNKVWIRQFSNITMDWVKDTDIELRDISFNDVREGVVNYGLQFKKGYWPYDEKVIDKLPKRIDLFFYNPFNKYCPSPFLKVLFNRPRPIRNKARYKNETEDRIKARTTREVIEEDHSFEAMIARGC
jgi:hypothetical protein